jgi:RNA polymerase sigma-70 factor (ECF subfamily)
MSGQDNDLVRACLAGSPEAFDELVDRYQMKIYNLALRITGNSEDAMDVTQETFLKAWDNLQRFDPAHRFFSWIYRIGTNEALNLVRGRKPESELAAEPAAPAPGPESRAQGRQTGRRIREGIASLSPDYRAVVVLRHFHGLSYEEMSEVIGISVGKVKSRLFSARKLLREHLTAEGLA